MMVLNTYDINIETETGKKRPQSTLANTIDKEKDSLRYYYPSKYIVYCLMLRDNFCKAISTFVNFEFCFLPIHVIMMSPTPRTNSAP